MKHLKRFNENHTWDERYDGFIDEVKSFIYNDEYEDGDEPTMADIMAEVGDLCNHYSLDDTDLDIIIKNSDDAYLNRILDSCKQGEWNNKMINLKVEELREISNSLKSINEIIIPNNEFGIKPGRVNASELIYFIADMLEK